MSEKLIGLLTSSNLIDLIRVVTIEKETNVPSEITHTPSLVIPNQKKILVADKVFKWVDEVNFLRGQRRLGEIGPIGYTKNEMGCLSDSFTYISGSSPPLPQSYRLNSYKDETIYTPEEKGKITETTQQALIFERQNLRKLQDDKLKTEMVRCQINALISDAEEKVNEAYMSLTS